MEPSAPNPQPVYKPGDSNQFNAQLPPVRRSWRLKILLGAIVVVLIAVAAYGAYLSKHKKSANSSSSGDTSLYYDRAGYDRKKLGTGVGDPLAITMTAKDGAQILSNGATVLPACAILSQKDLSDSGFKLYPNGFGYPIQQNYIDKSGRAFFGPDPAQFPTTSNSISCSYGLVSTKSSVQTVSVGVNQAFTVTNKNIDRAIDIKQLTKQADMDGYQVYKRVDGDTLRYLFRKDNDAITLNLQLDDPQQADGLVQKALSNLTSFTSKPKGVSTVTYNSPTFTKTYAKACDLVGNDEIKQLSGADASPLVYAHWATATGVADFSSLSDYKQQTNYLRNACQRFSNYPEYQTLAGNKTHTLDVTTTTYENTEAASKGLLYLSVTDGNNSKVKTAGVGEEAYLYRKEKQNTLAFRQGRVVVELVYDISFQDNDPRVADLTSYGQKLAPIGQTVAGKLKDYK